MATTDATGTASQLMDAGGYVTVVDAFYTIQLPRSVRPGGNRAYHDLHTWAGVKPGDHLLLADPGFGSTANAVTVPEEVGATAYSAYAAGGGSSFYAYSNFIDPATRMGSVDVYGSLATTDFLIVTQDANAGQFLYAANQSLATNTVDLSGGTYANNVDASFMFTNAPAIGTISATNYLATSRGPIWVGTSAADITSGAATLTFSARPEPALVTSIVETDVTPSGALAGQFLVDWKPIATATTYDLANRSLLPLTGDGPIFDQPTHAVTWTLGATGATPDAAVVNLRATRDSTEFRQWTWDIVAPHGATGIAYPVLPTGADAYNALTDDSIILDGVKLAKVPGGYDTIRAGALGGSILVGATATAQGSIAYETWPHNQVSIKATEGLAPVGQFLKNSLRAALH
jgi:hypothetical protein